MYCFTVSVFKSLKLACMSACQQTLDPETHYEVLGLNSGRKEGKKKVKPIQLINNKANVLKQLFNKN